MVSTASMAVYLSGRDQTLRRVGFHFDCWGLTTPTDSEWQGKWLWTHDAEFLHKVEAWHLKVTYLSGDRALRQRGGYIVLEFQTGRTVVLAFRGSDRPSPDAGCGNFILNGRDVADGDEPFSEFLRQPCLIHEKPQED
jgi:hypothetical protein